MQNKLEDTIMANPVSALKRIGILGGSSDQATVDYYVRLNKAVNRHRGGHNTAELLINSMNFALSAACVLEGRWDELGAYLAERAIALERGGADLLICVSNTLHRTAPVFMANIKIPLLHIVDPTARAIQHLGLKKVGLLGTKPVMAGTHISARFDELFGIETIVPDEAGQQLVNQIIFDELCAGVFTENSKTRYLEVMADLEKRGAQGVILGCTEIPLLVKQADRPNFPMFDTTALHVEEAVDFALGAPLAKPNKLS
ncbi:MAG TPA: amino acid racemase [Steroidobacteraceae bacterium]